MAVKPLHDYVVLRRLEAEEKTVGGIIIPDTVRKESSHGEVVAAGPGARTKSGKRAAMSVKPGDMVLLSRWVGNEVELDGEELLIVRESEILGILPATTRARLDSPASVDAA